jgi:predicted AlkP superfamily pyrophosphatase or phosphodiesterase
MRSSALALALAALGCASPPPAKVLVVGIDGAEWAVIDRLRAAGRMPALDALVARGTRGRLGTLRPTLSPALWTTVATGVPPAEHGIADFVLPRPEVTLRLADLPAGELDAHLEVEVAPPCEPRDLEVVLGDARTAAERRRRDFEHPAAAVEPSPRAPDRVHVRLPAAREPGAAVPLRLRLPPRCTPPVVAGSEPPAWGRLAAVRVTTRDGTPVAAPPVASLVENAEVSVRSDAGRGVLLVGRGTKQIESTDRRVPALWNIASAYGRTTGAVGWWGTYPAEAVRGTIVSDFLYFISTRRLRQRGTLDEAFATGAVHPPEARRLVLEAVTEGWEVSADELAQFVPREGPRFAAQLAVPADTRSAADPPVAVLKVNYLTNRPYFALARRLVAAATQPDLFLFYTNLVDAAEHRFWRWYEPERFRRVAPEDLADFGDTIPRVYAWVDRQLGAIVEAAADDTVVLVVSDHGHHAAGDGAVFSGDHADAPPGILVAAGPGIRAGGEVDGATILDVAPTVLALLGLPVAEDVPGRVLDELFVSPPRPARVATHRALPRDAPSRPSAGDLEPAVRARLRALGYL